MNQQSVLKELDKQNERVNIADEKKGKEMLQIKQIYQLSKHHKM